MATSPAAAASVGPADLLARTAELVDIASVSRAERQLADRVENEVREHPWLAVDRVGDNVVARTTLQRPQRVLLVGHLDTVPPNGNDRARIDGDTLWGLGAADMKGGLAVLLELARTVFSPAVDVSYVFYVGEEIESEHNGLGHLFRDRGDLLGGDLALIGEPTAGRLEAGCQGTMRARLILHGARAHTARPWMGRNAIHRLGAVLEAITAYEPRRPVIDGCEYREALQAVAVEAGVAGNVVPDRAVLTINHRFAPDRTPADAEAFVRGIVGPFLAEGDMFEVVDMSPPAPPALGDPLLAAFIARGDLAVDAKLGWTDVARFAAHGVPAANFGPGDSTLAHTADERVERTALNRCYDVLRGLLVEGLAPSPSE